MHVDVHILGSELQEQGDHRLPVTRQQIAIGRAQGALEQPVLDRSPVHEQMLMARRVVARSGQTDQPGQAHAVPPDLDRRRLVGEVAPHDLAHAGARLLEQIGGGYVESEDAPSVRMQGERDARIGHGQTLDHLAHRELLGAVGLQELEAGGRGEEQIAHLDPRADGSGRRRRRPRPPGLHAQREGALLPARAAGEAQPADAGERGQRLTAEAQRGDPDQLVVVELRSGVALDRQGQLVGRHADPVVGHRDQRPPARGHLDPDARRAGIDRVLDQLLDRRRRPLDHLAGSDPIDHARWQRTDGRHGCSAGRLRVGPGSMPARQTSGKMLPIAQGVRRDAPWAAQPSRPVGAPTTTVRSSSGS